MAATVQQIIQKKGDTTYSVAPDINNKLMSIGYNLFPSSSASVGQHEKLNWVQKAYARLFPGEHW